MRYLSVKRAKSAFLLFDLSISLLLFGIAALMALRCYVAGNNLIFMGKKKQKFYQQIANDIELQEKNSSQVETRKDTVVIAMGIKKNKELRLRKKAFVSYVRAPLCDKKKIVLFG